MTEKTSRRDAIKYAATAVVGVAVGGAVGWSAKPAPAPPPKGKFAEAPPEGTEVTIIHGFDAAYPPFTEIDPTGKAVGFDVEVVQLIAERYGWKVIPKPWDWSTIVTALVNGDVDIIESGMTHTPERAEKVWFSIPYYSYYHQLIASVNETRSMEEILNSGGYISCQLGATADSWAEKLLSKGYNFKKLALDSYALAFQAVLDGRAVAVISDSAFTGPYFAENPATAAKLKEIGKIGGIETYAIATRPEDNWLRNQINYALKDLMDSPKWDELKAKWLVV